MKKIYFLFLISTLGYSQSVSITKIIETDCASPYIKTVELYVSGTIDFANDPVTVDFMSNGGSWSNTRFDLTTLGSVTDSYIYLVRDIALMQADFPSITFDASNTISVGSATNGDDGYRVVINGNVVSQFGKDATKSGGNDIWDHDDSVVSRKIGVADSGIWDETHWEYSGKHSLDGEGLCARTASSSTGTGQTTYETFFTTLGNGHPLQSWTPTTASLNDINASKISVYPNPVHSNLKFTGLSGPVYASVYDMTGRLYLHKKVTNTLDMSNLKAGIYMLKIRNESGSKVFKIIKD
jgi:hypothetical protein